MPFKPSSSFLVLLLSSTALTGGAMAQTLPTGGSVAHGAATIGAPVNGQMTITQTTPNAIVNWQSFSIGAGGRVDIQQPGPTSVMLNRVTGNTPSTIAGQLNANGQVFLVNPNGVTISKSGGVNAGAFVASTLNITDEDFIAGRHRFTGNGASASVVNQGQINIARGGFAALLGGSVDNSGAISVPVGRVALGSGEEATLDFTGDGFLQIAVPTRSQDHEALVRNSGTISAPGGRVELSAATARQAVRHAVNMSGVIEATGVSGRNGAIVLSGGDGGGVKVSGRIDAGNAFGAGGRVAMTGRRIALRGATVDASGATGGGQIQIGGARQGGGGVAGLNSGALTYAYSAATVTAGAGGAGGVAGRNSGTLTQTWASGQIGGGALRGGLVGDNAGTMSASYWDSETTGQNAAAGAGDQSGATGLTQAQARDQANYVGWDFANDWFQTLELRPIGRWEAATPGADGFAVIDNLRQLQLVGANLDMNYRFARDIDASALIRDRNKPASIWGASGFMPIGFSYIHDDADGNSVIVDLPFTGELNGAGYNVVDLYIDRHFAADNPDIVDISGAGLFGATRGYLHDLGLTGGAATAGLTGPSIWGRGAALEFGGVGALAGWNRGRIAHVYSTLNVGGDDKVGGLVGSNSRMDASDVASITDSFTLGGAHPGMAANVVTLNADGDYGDNGGGLVGYNYGGDISRSFSTMSVYGTVHLGGLVGTNTPGLVDNEFVGGNLTDVYATGDVMAPLVSHPTTAISPVSALGGLVGSSAGLADYDVGIIRRAYATGNVGNPTAQSVGGLVGYASGTVYREVYSSGRVEGDPSWVCCPGDPPPAPPSESWFGGLVGTAPRNVFYNVFWDTQSSGVAEAQPPFIWGDTRLYGNHADQGVVNYGSQALTTAQARSQAPYAAYGWDFTTNWHQSGDMRPTLQALANVGPQPVAGVTTVYSIDQLQLAALKPGGAYRLGRDIDASDANGANPASVWGPGGFQPLGDATTPFTGSLDGAGHAIANLTINRPTENNVGLIGVQQGGVIQNIRLTNANVTGGNQVGALAGAASGGVFNSSAAGVVSGAYTTTTVAATSGANGDIVAGGLVGANEGAILNAYATGTTTATGTVPGGAAQRARAGGITGKNTGSVSKTYATGVSSATGATQNQAGAAIGDNAGTASATLFDTQTTGRSNGAGTGDTAGMSGHTTAQMQDIESFRSVYAGWDFADIWAPPNQIGQNNNSPTAYYPELYALSNITAVTPVPGAVTRVYGDANPTRPFAIYDGLHAGNIMRTPGTLTSVATTASPIGVYSASIDGAQTYDVANSTWRYVYLPGADLTVTPRPLAVAADAQSRAYGDPNPTLTWTVGERGLVNGDTLSGAMTTTATTASNVGAYGITQGSLAATGNYAMTFTGNTLSVTQRPLAVSADAQSRAYGDANPTLTWTVGERGLVNGDTLSGALTTAATTASNVGAYGITQGSLAATGNYAMTFTGNILDVTQRPLAVSADAKSRAYGDANPTLTYTVGARGLVNGDTLSGTLFTPATTASPPGTYDITQGTLTATGNYAMIFSPNFLTVQGETPPQPPSPRPTPVYDLRLSLAQASIGLPPLVSDLVRLNTVNGARHYSTKPFGAGESPPSIRYDATSLCLGDDRYGLNCPVLPTRRFTPSPDSTPARRNRR